MNDSTSFNTIGNGDLFVTTPEIAELVPGIKESNLQLFTEDFKENWTELQKKKQPGYEEKIGQRDITGYSFTIHEMLRSDEQALDALRQAVSGQVVIDLGAGDTPWGYYLACAGKAKAYLAIEHYHADKLTDQLFRHVESSLFFDKIIDQSVKKIPYSVIVEDMLTFLKRLPDDSVSLFAFGINYGVLNNPGYATEVGAEVVRVLSVGGVLVESHANAVVENMPPKRLQIVYEGLINIIRYL